jgi:ABC-type glycerol-3-phosphate transport system permease component
LNKRKLLNRFAIYLVNIVLSLVFLFPLAWMLISSFKPEVRLFADMGSVKAFLPLDFTMENYSSVFNRISIFRYILNSLFYICATLSVSLVINSMCGYALAKFRFKGRKLILALIISLMVFPFDTVMIPLYIVVAKMQLINSYAALIIPFMAKCFSIFMFRQFFMDIPDELIEASYIDGCNRFTSYFQIVLPISGAVFATVFILEFVTMWSDFVWPLIVLDKREMFTVQIGIQAFFSDPPIYYAQVMAALTLAVIPTIVIFLFFQKYYVQGIATTGLKG